MGTESPSSPLAARSATAREAPSGRAVAGAQAQGAAIRASSGGAAAVGVQRVPEQGLVVRQAAAELGRVLGEREGAGVIPIPHRLSGLPREGARALATLGRGDILGEMSLIDNQPRMASARVIGNAKLTVITQDDLAARLGKLGSDDKVLRRLIDVFVDRLRGQARLYE